MKIKSTLFILTLFGFMTFLMSHSGGRATSQGEGNTGAPGDDAKTCATCHSGGDFGASIAITLTDADGNEVSDYIAGQTYTVAATVNTTSNANGYGLQMVGLVDANNSNAGSLANQSTNAQIGQVGDRSYLEQAGLSALNEFSAEWTAPASGSGSVTFYAAGQAANGNGQTGGDDATQASFQFGENVVESTVEFNTVDLEISPNPIRDITTITFDEMVNGKMNIYSTNGQVLISKSINTQSINLDLSTFNTGTYVLTIETEEGITSRQIVKL